MLKLIQQLHDIATNRNWRVALENPFFMLLILVYLRHDNGLNTIKPIQSESTAIQQILL